MIDSWMVRQIQPTLNQFALDWIPKWLRANAVTVMGFLVGLLVLPLLWDQAYLLALIVILFNRFLDGLDGAIARRDGISDFGGFLDICCDFIFYSAVVFGFALADPQQNALAASFMIFSSRPNDSLTDGKRKNDAHAFHKARTLQPERWEGAHGSLWR